MLCSYIVCVVHSALVFVVVVVVFNGFTGTVRCVWCCSRCAQWRANGHETKLEGKSWGYRADVRPVLRARPGGTTGRTLPRTGMTRLTPAILRIQTMTTAHSSTFSNTDTKPLTGVARLPAANRPLVLSRFIEHCITGTIIGYSITHRAIKGATCSSSKLVSLLFPCCVHTLLWHVTQLHFLRLYL